MSKEVKDVILVTKRVFRHKPINGLSTTTFGLHLFYREDSQMFMAIATNLKENQGRNVTNAAEELATSVMHYFHLNPYRMWWIERNVELNGVITHPSIFQSQQFEEVNLPLFESQRFEAVHFKLESDEYVKPQWKHITQRQLYDDHLIKADHPELRAGFYPDLKMISDQWRAEERLSVVREINAMLFSQRRNERYIGYVMGQALDAMTLLCNATAEELEAMRSRLMVIAGEPED